MVTEIGQQAAIKVQLGSNSAPALRRADAVKDVAPADAKPEVLPVDGKNLPLESAAATRPEQLKELVSNLNELVQNVRRELQFSVDDDTGRTVIRVINRDTDEVIRQIPPEELLQLTRNFTGTEGLLVREKV